MFSTYRYNRLRRLGTVDGRFSTSNLNKEQEAAYIKLATAKWIRERKPVDFGLDITGFPEEEIEHLRNLMPSTPDPGTRMTTPHLVEYKKFGKDSLRMFVDGEPTDNVLSADLFSDYVKKNLRIPEIEAKYKALALSVSIRPGTLGTEMYAVSTYHLDGDLYTYTWPEMISKEYYEHDPVFVQRLYRAKFMNAAEQNLFRKQNIANS